MTNNKIKKIMRTREHRCGKFYKEVDVYGYFTGLNLSTCQASANEETERRESSLKQKKINAKNASRKLSQIVAANFTPNGIALHPTYADENLPLTETQALADRTNFIRRIKRECAKRGLAAPKYVAVTEYQLADAENNIKSVRFHHHMIVECGLSEIEIKDLWSTGRGKNRKRIGIINSDKLRFENGNCEGLVKYILKYPKRRHRWTASNGLKQPSHTAPNDAKYSNRQIERICTNGTVHDNTYWQKQFKGWRISEITPIYNDITGWSIYLKLYKPRP